MIIVIAFGSINVWAFNRTSSANYSNTYAISPNSFNVIDGSGYNVHSEDCTNFTSQSLYAGGLSMDLTWNSTVGYNQSFGRFYRVDSATWVGANALKNYLKNNNLATKIGSWSKNGTPAPYVTYAYVNNSSNMTSTDTGKVIVFYDWTGDGTMDHTALLVVNNGHSTYSGEGTGDLINQHSTNRYHVLWRPDYRQRDNEDDRICKTRVYAFAMN